MLSSRKEPEILDLFSEFLPHEIDASRSENLQDIDKYLEMKLKEPEIAEKIFKSGKDYQEIAKNITQKGEGNFLYIIHVIRAIREGLMDPGFPETFPAGLIGIYKLFFGRLFPEIEEYDHYRPILDVILAAQEPLTANQIGSYLNREAFQIRKDLQKLSAFFPERNNHYHIYHKSLKDWLYFFYSHSSS